MSDDSDTLKMIIEEFNLLKGQFVITDLHTIERLVAIGDDTQDYYYIFYDGKKITWHSCLTTVIPLKGYIEDKYYDRIVKQAKLNHWDQVDPRGFKEALKNHTKGWDIKSSLLTDFCWDIN